MVLILTVRDGNVSFNLPGGGASWQTAGRELVARAGQGVAVTVNTQRLAGAVAGAPGLVVLLASEGHSSDDPKIGTQNPETAWAAKTGRAYDRRFRRFWRTYEGQTVGDWEVLHVNRRVDEGIQPDLVLINREKREILIHDVTSEYDKAHFSKGEKYVEYFKNKYPDYHVEYGEGYWKKVIDFWEALDRNGNLYFPGKTKP